MMIRAAWSGAANLGSEMMPLRSIACRYAGKDVD